MVVKLKIKRRRRARQGKTCRGGRHDEAISGLLKVLMEYLFVAVRRNIVPSGMLGVEACAQDEIASEGDEGIQNSSREFDGERTISGDHVQLEGREVDSDSFHVPGVSESDPGEGNNVANNDGNPSAGSKNPIITYYRVVWDIKIFKRQEPSFLNCCHRHIVSLK